MIKLGIETFAARLRGVAARLRHPTLGALRRCSRVLSQVVFLIGLSALLAPATGCRANLPPPPSANGGSGGGAGGRGGTAGGGATGGAGSTAGAGGMDGGGATGGAGGTVDAASCGHPTEACCPGNRCVGGGCCEQGVCTSFGDVCKLSPGFSCLSGTCSNECGGVMNGISMKCCSMHNCTSALTVCDSAGPSVGACTACGKPGLPCCADNAGARTYCEANLTCTDGKCPGTAPPPPPIDAAPPIDTAPVDLRPTDTKG
jgi:hypothetical protein